MSINEAARTLKVSTRTIRRFIKAGKLQARLIPGPFGEEYRIDELPHELLKSKSKDSIITNQVTSERTSGSMAPQVQVSQSQNTKATSAELPQSPAELMNLIKQLQEMNMTLAAQLGAATERIRNLENQVKLIAAAPRPPWWKRLFHRKG